MKKVIEFPEDASENTVNGTLKWAQSSNFESVAIIGWKNREVYFGYSRLNNLIEKLGAFEYARAMIASDIGRDDK
jgi:hypothetical protein